MLIKISGTNKSKKSYSVLCKAVSLLEEEVAEDDRDGCLSQCEDTQGTLDSSAQFLWETAKSSIDWWSFMKIFMKIHVQITDTL